MAKSSIKPLKNHNKKKKEEKKKVEEEIKTAQKKEQELEAKLREEEKQKEAEEYHIKEEPQLPDLEDAVEAAEEAQEIKPQPEQEVAYTPRAQQQAPADVTRQEIQTYERSTGPVEEAYQHEKQAERYQSPQQQEAEEILSRKMAKKYQH